MSIDKPKTNLEQKAEKQFGECCLNKELVGLLQKELKRIKELGRADYANPNNGNGYFNEVLNKVYEGDLEVMFMVKKY